MATTRVRRSAPTPLSREPHSPVYGVLMGLASLGVLLQGLWAGLFLGRGSAGGYWIRMHAMGAQVTLLLAVLILLEGLIGVWTSGSTSLTAVHVPLAMLLLVLAVYLPVLHRRGAQPRPYPPSAHEAGGAGGAPHDDPGDRHHAEQHHRQRPGPRRLVEGPHDDRPRRREEVAGRLGHG